MHRFLILGAIGLAVGGLGVTRFASLEERLARLDEFQRTAPRAVAHLRSGYDDLGGRLESLVADLELLRSSKQSEQEGGRELRAELERLTEQLRLAQTELQEQRDSLGSLEARQAQWAEGEPEPNYDDRFAELEAGVQALEAGVDHRYTALNDVIRSTVNLVEDTRSEIRALSGNRGGNSQELWSETMGPIVQLAGNSTVGSGILLPSRLMPNGDYETLLLTAWHVVRDIRAETRDEEPIPVTIYERGGVLRHERAEVLRYEVDLDVALLRLNSKRPMAAGARLAARTKLRSVSVFDDVIAVGCPLGNDPIPTRGQVAETDHRVDGNTYWMISAPTYIGNSGGGIFDAETYELIGIFSKIYTHGNLRPTVVPHMGLITPLEQVYDWLEEEEVAEVVSDESVSGRTMKTNLVLSMND